MKKMDADTLNTLFDKALDGHGGKMKEQFTESAEAVQNKKSETDPIQLM